MNIKQIYEFKLCDRRSEQIVIVHFRRIDDYFLLEKRTQKGRLLDSDKVEESFAKIVLEQALISLPKPDLEITKFSDVKS